MDPKELPPDAVRVADEEVIVQDIEIKPRNLATVLGWYPSLVDAGVREFAAFVSRGGR